LAGRQKGPSLPAAKDGADGFHTIIYKMDEKIKANSVSILSARKILLKGCVDEGVLFFFLKMKRLKKR
jgi:hypothetical protein